MHPEIEYLINMALADGQVTEKEKAIILRKAESLNLDKDEVEMILDGRIALSNKESLNSQGASISGDNKEGQSERCPSCGSPVSSFTTVCSDCGHEFRNSDSNANIKMFYNKLQSIVEEENNRKHESTGLDRLIVNKSLVIEQRIYQRQISLITAFPIPNNKEDIIEFLILAMPEATKKLSFFAKVSGSTESHKGELKKAYFSKCEQLIMKARFSMKDDINSLQEIEHYARQLGIK
jgi:hypothetical protein